MAGEPLSPIGTVIGNHRLVSKLGEGGMGTVYLAENALTGRKRAIKILKRAFADDTSLVERFINEARATNDIGHPGIVDIVDVGQLEDGLPYLLMEYLEGESLASRLARNGRLHVRDAVDIAYQTASALAAAHARQIVHRDLKPENLFLVPDKDTPGRERVKVLDFGVAKLRPDLASPGQSRSGRVLGTPIYMSPEQCRGLSREIDHRTDIYSLGVILFEMLCGTPPFQSEGDGELLVMHITEQPPLPTSKNPGIPEHLEGVILRALAKQSSGRFASMAELSTALLAGPARTRPAVELEGAPVVPVSFPPTVILDLPPASSSAVSPAREAGRRTTFSKTVGELADGPPAVPRDRRPIVVGAVVVGVAVIVGLVMRQTGSKPSPAATSRPPTPVTVQAVPSAPPAVPGATTRSTPDAGVVAAEPAPPPAVAAPQPAPASPRRLRSAKVTAAVPAAAPPPPAQPPAQPPAAVPVPGEVPSAPRKSWVGRWE